MDTKTLGSLRLRIVTKRKKAQENDAAAPKAPLSRPPPDDRVLTCVLMHGFGAPGDDLVGLVDAIAAPPGVGRETRFVFPEAPNSLADLAPPEYRSVPGLDHARAWWMIDTAEAERAMRRGEVRDMSRQDPPGLAEARTRV